MAVPEAAEAGDLYALPLEAFTPARNELAARLGKAGDRAGAEQVKSLPKPSLTAWALNQVARSRPELVDELLSSADHLRRAQQQLLAGRNPESFREATQSERQAVGAVVRAAAGILAEDGHPAGKSTLDRLEATARAAASDPNHGQLLRAGTLSRDLDPAGFGGLSADVFGLPAEPIPFPKRPKSAPEPAPKPAMQLPEPDRRSAQLAAARETVRELQQQLTGLRKQASEAERVAASACQAVGKADRLWNEARQAAARAEKEAEHARRAQEEAAEELAGIRGRIDQTAEQLESAEENLRQLRR